MPMVRKPASAATLTSSGGVVSRTVRWAREIGRAELTRKIVPRRSAVGAVVRSRADRLLQPEGHAHLVIHRRSRRDVSPRVGRPFRPETESAQAEIAVRDQRTHAARLGERKSRAIVRFAAFGIKALPDAGQVAE